MLKKRKLLFIFTGGTIGSTVSEEYICLDEKKGYQLLEKYRKSYGIDFDYDTISPYTALSENNDGRVLSCLANCLLANLDKGYDGIIVTHGTDTLQYSAALCSYLMRDRIPLCLVSSAYPLEDERQNGIDNLHAAIKLIEEGCKGVYVPYRNRDGVLYIHEGDKLLASEAFSADFKSIENRYFARLEGEELILHPEAGKKKNGQVGLGIFDSAREEKKELFSFDRKAGKEIYLDPICRSVLRIRPYPGMPYPQIPAETKYILHETYHSGTFYAESEEAKAFFAEAKRRKIPVYLTGVTEGISYESTRLYEEHRLIPLYHMAPIAAYVGLWLLAEI